MKIKVTLILARGREKSMTPLQFNTSLIDIYTQM